VEKDDDKRLVARLREGDRGALEEVVHRHGPRLLRLAHRLLGWSGEAHDVVQEVFAKLLARPGKIGQNLEPWLWTVTLNQCRALRRRWGIRRRQEKQGGQFADPADLVPAQRELHWQVRVAVAKLAARDREVIVLHYLEEIPVDQIAAMLGLSRNAVEVRLHRARGHLKDRLGELMEP
jgi:RNA polymerase sigma-70 factor (ECF subfamily)